MSDMRKLVAAFIAVMALGIAAFGVVRGLSASGPARGTRLIVAIAPPIDADVVRVAEHVVRERLEQPGEQVRVVPAGDQLVVEVSEQDPQILGEMLSLVERTGKVELKAAGVTVLEGSAVRRTDVDDSGVLVDTKAPVNAPPGTPLDIVLDGKSRMTVTPDRVQPLHLPAADPRAKEELVAILDTGAAHPLHVVKHAEFTRATGFLPRAWPFLAIGAVLLLGAGVVARRRA